MSRWLFDLGNTRLKCAPLEGSVPGPVQALPHGAGALAAVLDGVLPTRIDVAYVSSVAAQAMRVELLEALVTRCRRIELARTRRVWAGVEIAYEDPSRLGVDRFLALLGARARFTGPVLLCGVGTAVTLDLLDARGRHRGGHIAPSPDLMREALHARASQLPLDGGGWVDWPTDTIDGLQSGCWGAVLALVRDRHDDARRLLGEEVTLCLHGGGIEPLLARLPGACSHPALVLEGLARWASQS